MDLFWTLEEGEGSTVVEVEDRTGLVWWRKGWFVVRILLLEESSSVWRRGLVRQQEAVLVEVEVLDMRVASLCCKG